MEDEIVLPCEDDHSRPSSIAEGIAYLDEGKGQSQGQEADEEMKFFRAKEEPAGYQYEDEVSGQSLQIEEGGIGPQHEAKNPA